MRIECPKCTAKQAWFEKTAQDLILRCTCGLHKVVATTIKKMEVQYADSGDDVSLPRKGTHLHATTMCLAVLERATSADITERLVELGHDFTVSDVSSYLTILRNKGLVVPVVIKRGIAGGSTWELTSSCKSLIGVG